MKTACLFTFILLLTSACFSQTAFKQNYISLQLGGNGLITSLNYERQLFQKTGLGLHAGIGWYGTTPTNAVIPIGINYLIPVGAKKTIFIEPGFGVTYTKSEVKLYIIVDRRNPYIHEKFFNYIPSLHLRYHTKNDWMMKLGLTPVITSNNFIPFAGFSFGKAF